MTIDDIDPLPRVTDYVSAVKRRWWLVAAITALGVVFGLLLAQRVDASYSAQSEVLVYPIAGAGPAAVVNPDTEAAVIESVAVGQLAREILGDSTDLTASELVDHVTASGAVDAGSARLAGASYVLRISYSGSVPERVRDGSQAFAQGYLDYRTTQVERIIDTQLEAVDRQVSELEGQEAAAAETALRLPNGTTARAEADALAARLRSEINSVLQTRTELQSVDTTAGEIISEATTPQTASGLPGPFLAFGAGLAALVLGVVVVVLFERLTDRVRTPEDLHHLAGTAPVVRLPHGRVHANSARSGAEELAAGRAVARGVGVLSDPLGAEADLFRQAQHRMLAHRADRHGEDEGGRHRTLLVAGTSDRQAGLVAASLAAVSAQEGQRTILVAASLREDPLEGLIITPSGPGLGEVLAGTSPLEEALVDVAGCEGLQVLPRGHSELAAKQLLRSGALEWLLSQLTEPVAAVVVGPSPLRYADGLLLAEEVDGVAVVIDANHTSRGDAEDLLSTMRSVGASIQGIILR